MEKLFITFLRLLFGVCVFVGPKQDVEEYVQYIEKRTLCEKYYQRKEEEEKLKASKASKKSASSKRGSGKKKKK